MNEPEIKYSPLCQKYILDNKSVDIVIYGDSSDGWLLEVEDTFGNTVLWDGKFETDKMALDVALEAIEKDGIDHFVGEATSIH